MTDIKETIQGLYALKTYLASKTIEEHGPARESLIGMQKVVDSAVNLLKEQEPKIGHWILDPDGMDWNIPAWTCSECGGRHNGLPIMDGLNEANIYQFAGSQFCPNCGAKMSKEVKWDA